MEEEFEERKMQPSSDLESFKIINEFSSMSMTRHLVVAPTHEI